MMRFVKKTALVWHALLLCACYAADVSMAANAPQTGITYNRNGVVTWDQGDAHFEYEDRNGDGIRDARSGDELFVNAGTNAQPVFAEAGTAMSLPEGGAGELIDYDGDGDDDFIARYTLKRYENTGTNASPVWVDRGALMAGGSPIANDFASFFYWNRANRPSIEYADWDGDGKKDLLILVTDRGSGVTGGIERNVYENGWVYWYRNTGTGAAPVFAAGQRLKVGTSDLIVPYQCNMSIVDWDGDGDLDIVCGDYRGKVFVIEHLATGVAAPVQILDIGNEIFYAEAADLDADGDFDLALHTTTGLLIYRNTGTNASPAFSFYAKSMVANGSGVTLGGDIFMTPWVVDWDGDGDADLLTGSENGFVYLYTNLGTNANKQFAEAVRLSAGGQEINFNSPTQGSYRWGPSETAVGYTSPVVADWDGDGDLDLITQDAEYAHLYYFQNTGTRTSPTLAAAVTFTLNGGDFTNPWRTRPAIVDYDNDGNLDILMTDGSDKIKVYSRTGGSQTNLTVLDTAKDELGADIVVPTNYPGLGMSDLQAFDWNGDGRFDLLAGTGITGSNQIDLFINEGTTGTPRFRHTQVKNADGSPYISVTDHEPKFFAVDWDLDGVADLLDVHPHGREKGEPYINVVNGRALDHTGLGDNMIWLNFAPFATIAVDSESGSYTKDRAVDENVKDASSRWLSTATQASHYYELSWSAAKTINRIQIWSGAGPGSVGFQIDDFTVQYWDGSGWQTAATVTDNPMDGALGEFNNLAIDPVSTTKLRLNITGPSHGTDNTARLIEIKALGPARNHAPTATASADSANGNYTPDKAIDGDTDQGASRWISTSTQAAHVYTLEWASAVRIDRVQIWSGGGLGAATGYQIDDFTVDYWNGSSWVTAATVTNNTKDSARGEFNDLAIATVTTTKLRLNITDPSHGTDNTARLQEIRAIGYAVNLAPSATATADSVYASYTADKAIDGDNATYTSRWISDDAEAHHVYELQWPSIQNLMRIKIYSGGGTGSAAGYQIDDFTVRLWDGGAWQTVATIADNDKDGSLGQYNDIVLDREMFTDRLRIDITDPSHGTDNRARLLEVEAYGYPAVPQ